MMNEEDFKKKCSSGKGTLEEAGEKLVCKIDDTQIEFDKKEGKTRLVKENMSDEDINRALE